MGEISLNTGVRSKIYKMILPVTIENVLQMTAGFVSMAMIGRISPIAVGAIGISSRVSNLIWALFKGIATGGSVFVAQAYGAGDYKKLKHVIQQTLLSSIILVIILQQIIFYKTPLFLKFFDPDMELLLEATSYLRIVSWGLPFVAIMLVVAAALQGMGNAKTPMLIALIMNIVNIFFSFVLIFGKLGLSQMGVKGAGIALVIAQFVGAAIGLYILFNKAGVLNKTKIKDFVKFDIGEVKSVYRVGMPTSFEQMFWQIAAIILTKVILSFGEIALAAYQLGLQAESISYMPAVGFAVASTTFIGQAVGARDKEIGKVYMKEIIKGSMALTSISVIALLFFPKSIMRLLTDNREVINLGAKYLIIMGFVQIPQNLSNALNGALRGAGYTKVPMIVAGLGLWGIRIPFSLIMTYYFKMNVVSIWIVMCFDLVFRFILSLTLYKTKNIYNSKALVSKIEA